MSRSYFVAVNAYRSSTDHGFANTWGVMRCESAKQQRHILNVGLPVGDQWWEDSDGKRHASISTMGIRAATRSEIREALKDGGVRLIN